VSTGGGFFANVGDFLGFNPQCHILVTDGCFYGDGGMFRIAPPFELKKLEAIFRHKIFRMLLNKGKITEEMIRILSIWKHSGFHVFCRSRISPNADTAMENLARYIIRASFSQERMQDLDQEGKVIYTAKGKKSCKVSPALEWLATMCSHIPNRGEQMVRYYGYYGNVSRGKRQKEGSDEAIPCILEPQGDEKIFRRNWARLIQKIGACPGEGREGISLGLSEMSGGHAGHQQHRRPVGHPGHPQASGNLAGPVQAAAESSRPANPAIRRCRSPAPNTRRYYLRRPRIHMG